MDAEGEGQQLEAMQVGRGEGVPAVAQCMVREMTAAGMREGAEQLQL